MKRFKSALALAGLLSLNVQAGTWSPTSQAPMSYAAEAIMRLRGTGEAMTISAGFVQRYNPYTDTWRITSPMCSPGMCSNPMLTEFPSGKVLAISRAPGRMGGEVRLSTYSPTTDQWTYLTQGFQVYRMDPAMTLLPSGRALVTGGYHYPSIPRATALSSVEEFDPVTETWTLLPGQMLTARSFHSATVLYSGKVLVTGGYTSDFQPIASAELYDPATGTWTAAGTLSHPRGRHQAIRLGSGHVMVLSNNQEGPSETATAVDIYDPYNQRWYAGPALPFTQPSSATLLTTNEVLVTNNSGQAALYSPSQNAWWLEPSSSPSSYLRPAVLLYTGQVLFMPGNRLSAERYMR
ncbi:kelch repeat-containing protein [Stigmatella sp. ncwal1]|uniref:Kelch repeat-containing protein n=1 Tax=Stigmatella ashevillensis TaxID=2995309 RepID=A0ABT5DB48_9BACT|nr:kelch repeat-containing protein [Stigmatella ashevillena]MDC0710861.1 kelch repeat-containing protein [Stigmatella ashevillena]